jgi:hypothetical protein
MQLFFKNGIGEGTTFQDGLLFRGSTDCMSSNTVLLTAYLKKSGQEFVLPRFNKENYLQALFLLQLESAQSIAPSQSLSIPSVHFFSVADVGTHTPAQAGSPLQLESAQSIFPSQSSSMLLLQTSAAPGFTAALPSLQSTAVPQVDST